MSTIEVETHRRGRWVKALPDVVATGATFLAVLALQPVSKGFAFPAPPPPELVAVAKGANVSALETCQSAWLSLASLSGSAPSYFTASLGPNFSTVPSFDPTMSLVLAASISAMVGMNLALARHLRGLITTTQR